MAETASLERVSAFQRYRFLVVAVLFLGFPLAVAGYFSLFSLDLEEQYRRRQAQVSLERELDDLLQRSDPDQHLLSRFQAFSRQLGQAKITERRLAVLFEQARQQWVGDFEPYVFDEEGRLILTRSNLSAQHLSGPKALGPPCRSPAFQPEDVSRKRKLFQNLFGSEFRVSQLAGLPGRLHPIRAGGKEGILFWQRCEKQGFAGQILLAWEKPSPELLLEHATRSWVFPRFSVILQGPLGEAKVMGKTLPQAVSEVVRRLEISNEPWSLLDGWQWIPGQIGPVRLWLGSPAFGLNLDSQRRILMGAVVGLLLLICGLGWRLSGEAKRWYLSVRWKTLGLFLITVMMPLVGLGFLGFQAWRDRRDILEIEVEQRARNRLLALDEGMVSCARNFLDLCRATRSRWAEHPDVKKIAREGQRLLETGALGHFEIRGIQGESLAGAGRFGSFEGMEATLAVVAKTCIERDLPDRRIAMGLPAQILDETTRDLLANKQMGFSHLISNPDQVQTFRFGTKAFYWYWDVFPQASGTIAYLSLARPLTSFYPEYLGSALKNSLADKDCVLLARAESTGQWFPPVRESPRLDKLMNRAHLSGRLARETLSWKGQTWLGVAVPGKSLADHSLVALYPEGRLQEELDRLRQLIHWAVVLSLLAAFLAGRLLAGSFLVPLSDLSKGMLALRQRKPGCQVPVQSSDEMGDLARTFNRMLEDLKEMELARVVQASLVPQDVPSIPGYLLTLDNRSADDLGGDYVDVLPMPGGRFLLIIGDVSGHGVSSALLMAMAKAVAFEFALEKNVAPSELLNRLNSLIYHLMKRRKLMTFFAAILDPASHTLVFSNAGHPYPLMVSSDGDIRELQLIHLPLGLLVKRQDFEERTVEVSPDSALFLYTDGLVEAVDAQGVMWGYEALTERLPGWVNLTPLEWKERLWKSFREHHPDPSLEDDVTFLIIKRTGN